MEDEDNRTVWVGNFDPENTTQEILYELFLQAGPLHYVKIPKDKTSGRNKSFAFICYRHSVSVPYAIELMNGIAVYGRNLRVQSRNHQQLQQQGLASGPGGIHSLDPNFGQVQNFSGPSQPCGQQALMQTPSLLGMAGNNIFAMAQQQMALLNAFQPIPLAVNPLLNAPRERYSDRHGSLDYGRNNQYMRDNYSRSSSYQRDDYSRNSPYQRDSYSNGNRKDSHNRQDASFNPYSNRNFKDKSGMAGDMQRHQGRFDYNRLGPPSSRDRHHSPHSNDHYSRHSDRQDGHRSESQHNKYDSYRSSGRHHSSRHDIVMKHTYRREDQLIRITVMGVVTHCKKITEMKVATPMTPRPFTLVGAVGYHTSSNTVTFLLPAAFLTTASAALLADKVCKYESKNNHEGGESQDSCLKEGKCTNSGDLQVNWLPYSNCHVQPPGTVPTPKPRPEPSKKTSLKINMIMKRELLKNPSISTTEIMKNHPDLLKKVTQRTARQRIQLDFFCRLQLL